MSDVLVLDLETQKSFDEVGGRNNFHLLRVSVLCLYSYERDAFECFTEWEVPGLLPTLTASRLIVGFNIKRFDYAVMSPYFKKPLDRLPTLDLLEEVANALGHRVSLNALATETLGTAKLGNGLDALEYWKRGELEKLKTYCREDVRITRDLYEYGKTHGRLYYRKDGERREVTVRWGESVAVEV
jgi:DEAD/DEAH box helicase domain-containing protein